MIEINSTELKIPFRNAFRHSQAERNRTQSIFVTVKRGRHSGMGESCPRKYVTGETIHACLGWIKKHQALIADQCDDLHNLKNWVHRNRNKIDKNPSAWCAVEMALLDLFAIEQNRTVEELLGLNSSAGTYQYTAVIGDSHFSEFEKILSVYAGLGFGDYKLKISGNADTDLKKIQKTIASVKDVRVRLDANNLWASKYQEAEAYLTTIRRKIFAMEEPLSIRDYKGMEQLSRKFSLPIIFDESVCNIEDLKRISLMPDKCIINVRISKMGGLLRTLELIDKIKTYGFNIIVGCLVGETSLLSRAALIAAKFSRGHLIAQEGAFSDLLLAYDYVRPAIRFAAKGLFHFKEPDKTDENWQPGWGLTITH